MEQFMPMSREDKYRALSFDVVLPSHLLLNSDLEPNAKLFYGLVRNLTKSEGYCWATNRYLSELMDVDVSTIKRWLNGLQKHGYIEIDHDEENSFNSQRYIYIRDDFNKSLRRLKNNPPPAQKKSDPSSKTSDPLYKDERRYMKEDNIPKMGDEMLKDYFKKAKLDDKQIDQATAYHKANEEILKTKDNPIGYVVYMIKNDGDMKDAHLKEIIEQRKAYAKTQEYSVAAGYLEAGKERVVKFSGGLQTIIKYTINHPFWDNAKLPLPA